MKFEIIYFNEIQNIFQWYLKSYSPMKYKIRYFNEIQIYLF